MNDLPGDDPGAALPESGDYDVARVGRLREIAEEAVTGRLGDCVASAIEIYEQIEDGYARELAEPAALFSLRMMAARARPSMDLFSEPPRLPRAIGDNQFLQLWRMEMAVNELCYACESINHAAQLTWGGSAGTRFYLNSFYHYVSALFLVDAEKDSHKKMPMGGTAIMALHPLGLALFLVPIKEVLDAPLGTSRFGTVILRIRNQDLVHGSFSIGTSEYLISMANMRAPGWAEAFKGLVWRLLQRMVLLDLRLLAILASSGMTFDEVAERHMKRHPPTA